ncbi:hypothetical protein ACXATC_004037 [Clostridium sporogenes]
MDIKEIAKKMTREEFLKNCGKSLFTDYEISCPSDVDIYKDCNSCSNCKECWKDAIKNIKFKGDEDIKFNWEGFKNSEFMVHCDTEEKAKDFIKQCYDKGIEWKYDGSKNKTNWHIHEKDTCYVINDIYNNILNHCRIKFCIEQGFKIIEWEIDKMDYDREYNIVEIMEFPEGTEFVRISDELFVKIGYSNNWECKILISGYTERPCKLSDIWTKSKFKLIRKDKKVSFEEAIQAYGKDIYCIWIDDDEIEHKSEYCIRNEWEQCITDQNCEYLTPTEIVKGEWYIKED